MWALLVAIVLVLAIGGCSVVFGSGSATTRVDRRVDVASDNEASLDAQVGPKDKKQ